MKKLDRVCEGRKLGLTVTMNKVSVVEKERQFLQAEFNFNRYLWACLTHINNLAAVTVRLLVHRTS